MQRSSSDRDSRWGFVCMTLGVAYSGCLLLGLPRSVEEVLGSRSLRPALASFLFLALYFAMALALVATLGLSRARSRATAPARLPRRPRRACGTCVDRLMEPVMVRGH